MTCNSQMKQVTEEDVCTSETLMCHAYQLTCQLVCLFEWTPFQRKEIGIPLGILPHVREQNKCSYFPRPGQTYHRSCWESNPVPCSTTSNHANPGRLEFSLPRRNLGVHSAPGQTPGIVQTLCRTFRAFRQFPIYKPNSIVPVAWIIESVTDSWLSLPVNYAGGFRHMIQQIQQDNNIANFHIAKIILCLVIFLKEQRAKRQHLSVVYVLFML